MVVAYAFSWWKEHSYNNQGGGKHDITSLDVGNILCGREAFHRAHKQKSLDYVYDNPESISVLLPCENWGALKEVYGIY